MRLDYKIKLASSAVIWCGAVGFLWYTHPQLSFIYVTPGIRTADGRWDFIIGHRGPDPVNTIQVFFRDQDWLKHVAASGEPLPVSNDHEQLLTFQEIDPAGRGTVFARQFLMAPFDPDYSHFTADITTRAMDYGEDIYIANVEGKWFFAMTTRQRGTTHKLFECKDAGFPDGKVKIASRSPCTPYRTSTI